MFRCRIFSNFFGLLFIFAKAFLPVIGFFLSLFFRPRNSRIVFSQTRERYNGNSKYLFEYLESKGWDVCWIYTSKAQQDRIPGQLRQKSAARYSLEGLLFSLTAQVAVISHGSCDFGLYWNFVKNRFVLNLWHGTGIKCLGVLDKNISSRHAKKYISDETSYYDAVTVASDVFRFVFCASHGVDVRKIHVTGDPRVDQYLEQRNQKNQSKELKILYAPTFRDHGLSVDLFFPFSDFSVEGLESYLIANPDIIYYLRPHPSDPHAVIQARQLEQSFPGRIVNFSISVCDDIDARLHEFDVIVSDYSSIHFEPLLADVPCIFVPFDLKSYFSDRGLAFDYDVVTPGPKVDSFCELCNEVDMARVGSPEWSQRRKFVRDLFFNYHDSSSCARIESFLTDVCK